MTERNNLKELNEAYNYAKKQNNVDIMYACAKEIAYYNMDRNELVNEDVGNQLKNNEHIINEIGTIGWAVHTIKNGAKVCRSGWNEKGMWLRLYSPYNDKEFPIQEIEPCDGTPSDWIGMKTTDNTFIPWLCSQSDILANDWEMANV